MTRDDVFEMHRSIWEWCFRCKLANQEDRQVVPVPMGARITEQGPPHRAPKPAKILIVTSCPDRMQSFFGASVPEEKKSPTVRAIERTWSELKGTQPYPLKEVAITSGLGCRHLDFASIDKLVKPTVTSVNICKFRLQAEVMMFDPIMVLCAGHAAFMAMTGMTKVTEYTNRYEEGFLWEFQSPGGRMMRYPAYVMPDPQVAVSNGRKDQWEDSFHFKRPMLPAHEPVQYMYWTFWRGLNLCHALEASRKDAPPGDTWLDVVEKVDEFHNARISQASVEAAVMQTVRPIQEQEQQLSARDAFLFELLDKDRSDEDAPGPTEDEDEDVPDLFEDEDE